ncbi:MAG: hypothetical protein JRJ12_06020 [Deltaproteobacteria bacterium]|nr:hypothetical protein [Deltaproteobacteria bacterium]MBW2070745.1 hypothetical protein [Deltaproteobacteria bacterium]
MILSIVCPFCDREHPVPTDFDCVYVCDCGACYKICGGNILNKRLASSAIAMDTADPITTFEDDELEFCEMVINHDFDQLISLKQEIDDGPQMRFCKYDPSERLALVWMKRPF